MLYEVITAVRYKYYAYRWHYSYAIQMHHKYMIVDGKRLFTGSYNYSDNAEHNTMENVVIYDAAAFPALVAAFVANFEALWQTVITSYSIHYTKLCEAMARLVASGTR